MDDISKKNEIICFLKLHYTKQLLPSSTHDCDWKMECHNWQVKEAIHFHLPTSCSMLLLIRPSNIFEPILEYFLHLKSILNQDPPNLDAILFRLAWIKKNQLDNQNINKIS